MKTVLQLLREYSEEWDVHQDPSVLGAVVTIITKDALTDHQKERIEISAAYYGGHTKVTFNLRRNGNE